MEVAPAWLIYALTDPQSGEVRYIGVSFRAKDRLREHLSRARKGYRTHLYSWIRSVLTAHQQPGWCVLERGIGYATWQEAEKRWIASFPRGQLCNHTEGGEGTPGYVPTAEQRALWSRQRKGVPYAPDRARPMLGRRHSAEARRKIGEASKKRKGKDSEETKMRRSEAAKRRGISPETLAKMQAASLITRRTEESRQRARAAHPGRRLFCVETGEVYSSIRAAARAICASKEAVQYALKANRPCKGYTFRPLQFPLTPK